MLDVMAVDVGNALGDLTARHAAAEREDLVSNVVDNFSWCLTGHQFVVKLVTAAENFNVVEEVGVDCW